MGKVTIYGKIHDAQLRAGEQTLAIFNGHTTFGDDKFYVETATKTRFGISIALKNRIEWYSQNGSLFHVEEVTLVPNFS